MDNVLFLFTDQWKADCFSYRGHNVVKTPNLDKLAEKSTDFMNSHTVTPLCTPARGSIFTGLYPHQSGVIDNCDVGGSRQEYLPASAFTWLDAMEKSGRKVGYFGKWHLGGDWDGCRNAMEFDILREEGNRIKHINKTEVPFVTERGQLIPNLGERYVKEVDGNKLPFYGKIESCEERYEYKIKERAKEFLEEHKEKPWCLTVSFAGPHFPSVLPEPYYSMYPYEDMELPESITDTYFNKPWYQSRNWWPSVATDDFTKENWKKTISAYYGCITMMDDFLGEVLKKAEECSGGRKTRVVFTADHGEMLGAHARFDKNAYFYEEVVRTPLLYCEDLSGKQKGTKDTRFCNTLDLSQTFFNMAGYQAKNGESLLEKDKKEDQVVFGNYYKYNGHSFEIRSVKTNRYKYSFIPQDIDELYDLQNDPYEMHNLSDVEEYSEIKKELKEKVVQNMIQTDDYLLEFLEKGLPEAGTVGRIPYPKLQENYEQIKRG